MRPPYRGSEVRRSHRSGRTARRLAFAVLVAVIASTQPARAAEATIGIEPIYLTGRHEEPGYNVSGALFGALGEVTLRQGALGIKVEGIPPLPRRSGITSGTAGWPQVSALDADLRYFTKSGIFAGLGEAVYNQSTPFYTPSEVEYTNSRLAGARYSVGGHFPLPKRSFIEAELAVMPHLNGLISYVQTPPKAPRAEYASNVETELAAGMRRNRWEYLAGVHGFNLAANFSDGAAADRNVAYGIFVEARLVLGR